LALDWLVNGVRLGGATDADATRVIRGWPSMYVQDGGLAVFAPVFAEAAKRGRSGGPASERHPETRGVSA
jgi:hypothetical protein